MGTGILWKEAEPYIVEGDVSDDSLQCNEEHLQWSVKIPFETDNVSKETDHVSYYSGDTTDAKVGDGEEYELNILCSKDNLFSFKIADGYHKDAGSDGEDLTD